MSVTSSSNISLLSSVLCFSNTSLYPHIFKCLDYTSSSRIFAVFTIVNILLFPLYFLVLLMGFQRWHQSSIKSGRPGHSDVFTYCTAALELITVLGSVFFCGAIYTCSLKMKMVGYYSFTVTYPGLTFFHCLTCVERYLAVVHPVTFRALRQVRNRNISVGCVWLMCSGSLGLAVLYFPDIPTSVYFAIFAVTAFIVIFCSFSVLYALIGLGLWKVGGTRKQIDQSKLRSFNTITVITGALLLRSLGITVCNIMFDSAGGGEIGCLMLMSGVWLCLPSSLVLPLLFLYRAGTLSCFSCNLAKGET